MDNNKEHRPKDEYYNYLFHWNNYTNTWNCFPREGIRDYFNGIKKFGSGQTIDIAYMDLVGSNTKIEKGEVNCC